MPSKSKAQHRLMEAAAHGYSKKVPIKVAKEFVAADGKGKVRRLPERKGK